jgi:tetratricopeptide (TPR) repeat protein
MDLKVILSKILRFALYVGIMFMPYLFAWVTLRKGFSTKERVYSIGWAVLGTGFLVYVTSVSPTTTSSATVSSSSPSSINSANQNTNQQTQQETVKQSEPPVQQPTQQLTTATNQTKQKSVSDERYLVKLADTGLYGYINKNGKIVIPPQFPEAGEFSNGLAQFRLNRKSGYINTSGEIVITPIFDDTVDSVLDKRTRFADNGLAGVEINGKVGYVNKTGKFVIQPQFFTIAGEFSDGLAEVSVFEGNKKIKGGYIDESGKFVIEEEFEGSFGEFKNGLASFKREKTGLSLILNKFATYGKYGYIDKSGDIVIDEQFDYASDFNDNGLAMVKIIDAQKKEKYGFINKKGKFVIPPTLTRAGSDFSSNGLVAASDGDKHGYMNKDGEFVLLLPPEIYGSDFADNGLAKASIDDGNRYKVGFIDVKGKFVIPPVLCGDTEGFKNGLALVCLETKEGIKRGYINERGEWVSDLTVHDKSQQVVEPVQQNQSTQAAPEQPTSSQNEYVQQSATPKSQSTAPASVSTFIEEMIVSVSDIDKRTEAQKKIEALPKPHGNKKEARKLNDEALVFVKQGDYQSALPIMLSAANADPADVEILNSLGYLQYMTHDYDAAKQSLYQTISLKPDRTTAWADLGKVFLAQGNELYAKNCYLNFYLSSQQPDKAIEILLKSVPDNPALTKVKKMAHDEIMTWDFGGD